MSSEGNTVRPTAGAQADDSDSQHGVLTEDEGEGVLAPLGFLRGSSFILQFYWGLWKRYSQINIRRIVRSWSKHDPTHLHENILAL